MLNLPNRYTLQIVLGAALVWLVTLVMSVKYPEQRTDLTLWITIISAVVAVFFSLEGMNHLIHGRRVFGDKYRP